MRASETPIAEARLRRREIVGPGLDVRERVHAGAVGFRRGRSVRGFINERDFRAHNDRAGRVTDGPLDEARARTLPENRKGCGQNHTQHQNAIGSQFSHSIPPFRNTRATRTLPPQPSSRRPTNRTFLRDPHADDFIPTQKRTTTRLAAKLSVFITLWILFVNREKPYFTNKFSSLCESALRAPTCAVAEASRRLRSMQASSSQATFNSHQRRWGHRRYSPGRSCAGLRVHVWGHARSIRWADDVFRRGLGFCISPCEAPRTGPRRFVREKVS